jgi:hypothetical protein
MFLCNIFGNYVNVVLSLHTLPKSPQLFHTLATKVVISLELFVVDLESFAIGGAK